MTAALLFPVLMIALVQDFPEALGQIGRPEDLRQEQNRPARVFMLRDDQKCALKHRIGRELFGAGIKPGIDFRVDRAQFRLKTWRIAFRVVHQKSWIDAEESRQQFARCVRQMRKERSLSPSFMKNSLIAICKYIITYRYFVKQKMTPVFNNLQT